jgi:ABC-type transporter Mla subunit MlaD
VADILETNDDDVIARFQEYGALLRDANTLISKLQGEKDELAKSNDYYIGVANHTEEALAAERKQNHILIEQVKKLEQKLEDYRNAAEHWHEHQRIEKERQKNISQQLAKEEAEKLRAMLGAQHAHPNGPSSQKPQAWNITVKSGDKRS